MKILNYGSMNIDYVYKVDHIVKKGETISSQSLSIFSGGKGLNQSVALGRAGCNVRHAGAVGTDGLFLIEVLKEAGVDVSAIDISEEIRTGNAIIQNDKTGDNCIILYPGANMSITRQQIDKTLDSFAAGDYLVLQNEINDIPYIVDKAYEKGMIVVLNPSPMNEGIYKIDLNKISYFILNEIEAGQLIKKETKDATILIEGLKSNFPKAKIVLTMGEMGSYYIEEDILLRQEIYKVATVDTTAAGDTFSGYFIASIIDGKSPEESLDIAAKASSLAVTKMGAVPSIPWMKEIKNA